MKQNRFFYFLLIVVVIFQLTSCSDTPTDPPIPFKSTIVSQTKITTITKNDISMLATAVGVNITPIYDVDMYKVEYTS